MNIKILKYDRIDSTNEEAKRLIPNIDGWNVIVAREQTKGKGRSGRIWQSSKDKGLYMSIVFKVDADFENIAITSFLLSLAVVEYIKSIDENINIGIKWPNDILVDSKKLSGILPEVVYKKDGIYLICGIGINLKYDQDDYKGDYKENAISLYDVLDKDIDIDSLITGILEKFYDIYKDYNMNGPKDIMIRYKKHSLAISRKVKLIGKKNSEIGYVKDILDTGEIVVDVEGIIKKINYGEISIRGIDKYF